MSVCILTIKIITMSYLTDFRGKLLTVNQVVERRIWLVDDLLV